MFAQLSQAMGDLAKELQLDQLVDQVRDGVNLAVKDLKRMLNTEIFGPNGPIKQYRGELWGAGASL